MDEFCEAIADLRDDLESEINLSFNVVEVVTIAHKHAMPAENLGFFMPDMSLLPPDPAVAKGSDDKDDASSGYSASIALDRVGHSVISYDYGFCSKLDDGSDKLPCLVMHDRDTRLLGAIPTAQKGGKYLQYVITEFVRFIMHTQHKEVALRSDLEPTNLAILDGVRKTCRGLGITIHHEPVPVSDHQANGAAESSLQQIRSRAGIFIEQIEKACAGGKKVFPCSHPLYAWAILHSAWIHNHLPMKGSQTERTQVSWRCLESACLAISKLTERLQLDGNVEFGWERAWSMMCILLHREPTSL